MGLDLAALVGKSVEMVVNEDGGKQSHLAARFDLIPPIELFEVAIVLAEGAEKYGERNWQKIKTNDHLSHALAHIYAFLAGDTSDDHLPHALCRLLFASYTQKHEAKTAESFTLERAYHRLVEYCSSVEQELEQTRAELERANGKRPHCEPSADGVRESIEREKNTFKRLITDLHDKLAS